MFGRREESYIKHEGSFHPLFNSDDQMIGFTMSILFWSTSYNYYKNLNIFMSLLLNNFHLYNFI